jgi:Zn ribbon nucleic-acid-binding protein
MTPHPIVGALIDQDRFKSSGKCEQCGKEADLRPYGPNGQKICVECGCKDEEATIKRIKALFEPLIFGGKK